MQTTRSASRAASAVAVDLGGADHALEPERAAGAHDPHGDLAAVGHEHARDRHDAGSTRNSGAPYSTSSAFSAHTSTTVPRHPGLDRVHHLHDLDQAHDGVGLDARADLHERRGARRLGAVEGAEHRRVDRHRAVGGRSAPRAPATGRRRRRRRGVAALRRGAPPRRTCSLKLRRLDPQLVERRTRRSAAGSRGRPRRVRRHAQLRRRRAEGAHHQRRSPTPAARAGLALPRRAVTGRDWRTNSRRRRGAIAHSTSWWPPKWRSTRRADVDQRQRAARRRGRPRRRRSSGTSTRTVPGAVRVRDVLDVLGGDRRGAATSRVTLLTRYSSGVTSPPTTASPRPQLALTATVLGSPLTGLQVNMHARHLRVDHPLHGRRPSRAARSPEPRAVADRLGR